MALRVTLLLALLVACHALHHDAQGKESAKESAKKSAKESVKEGLVDTALGVLGRLIEDEYLYTVGNASVNQVFAFTIGLAVALYVASLILSSNSAPLAKVDRLPHPHVPYHDASFDASPVIERALKVGAQSYE